MVDKNEELPPVIWPDRPQRPKTQVVLATAALPRLPTRSATSALQRYPVLERIELPKDSTKLAQLQLKHEEYQQRVVFWESLIAEAGFASGTEEAKGTALIRLGSERFKVEILGRLLVKRVIFMEDFLKDLQQPPFKTSEAALEAFNNSWKVIRNYCEKGGEGLQFGTGLPKLSLLQKIRRSLLE